MTTSEIERRFTSHKVDEERGAKIDALRKAFINLALTVENLVPAGREQAIVLTKIEEASFFAVAGVARPQA